MPSQSSKLLQELIDVSYQLSEVIEAADRPHEDFHPNYKTNRDAFRRLIAARTHLESRLRKYFREATDRILQGNEFSSVRIINHFVDQLRRFFDRGIIF